MEPVGIQNKSLIMEKVLSWIKILRLQFYPMNWIAYTAGAFGARTLGFDFNSSTFWIGLLGVFFVEVATVLINEYYDYETDRLNKNHSPFNGGSRMLIDSKLSFKELKSGILVTLILSLICFLAILVSLPADMRIQTALLVIVLSVCALGYTLPPIKLSYRGLGELNVSAIHSFGVILCGFAFQGANLLNSFPWLLSIPLFLAIFPSIILAGVPDYEADAAASKKTLAVRLGRKQATALACLITLASVIALALWKTLGIIDSISNLWIYLIAGHALILLFFLIKYIRSPQPPATINALMVLSLSYVLWFSLVPLFKLM